MVRATRAINSYPNYLLRQDECQPGAAVIREDNVRSLLIATNGTAQHRPSRSGTLSDRGSGTSPRRWSEISNVPICDISRWWIRVPTNPPSPSLSTPHPFSPQQLQTAWQASECHSVSNVVMYVCIQSFPWQQFQVGSLDVKKPMSQQFFLKNLAVVGRPFRCKLPLLVEY